MRDSLLGLATVFVGLVLFAQGIMVENTLLWMLGAFMAACGARYGK